MLLLIFFRIERHNTSCILYNTYIVSEKIYLFHIVLLHLAKIQTHNVHVIMQNVLIVIYYILYCNIILRCNTHRHFTLSVENNRHRKEEGLGTLLILFLISIYRLDIDVHIK